MKNKYFPSLFMQALQLIFITLKLCGVIDWHWGAVLLPFVIPVCFLWFIIVSMSVLIWVMEFLMWVIESFERRFGK